MRDVFSLNQRLTLRQKVSSARSLILLFKTIDFFLTLYSVSSGRKKNTLVLCHTHLHFLAAINLMWNVKVSSTPESEVPTAVGTSLRTEVSEMELKERSRYGLVAAGCWLSGRERCSVRARD